MAVVRHLIEEVLIVFFESYLVKDGSTQKQALNMLVAEYVQYCREGVTGLPTFDLRPFNKSLPLAEHLRCNHWTRKEKSTLAILCAEYRDAPLQRQDVISAICVRLDEATRKNRTSSAVAIMIRKLELLPVSVLRSQYIEPPEVAEGQRVADLLIRKNPTLTASHLASQLAADLKVVRPDTDYTVGSLKTYLNAARFAAGLVHDKSRPRWIVFPAFSEPVRRPDVIRQKLMQSEYHTTLEQLLELQRYISDMRTQAPNAIKLGRCMLKHLEDKHIQCTSTALYRATGVYINGDNEADIVPSVKSCLAIAIKHATTNGDRMYLYSQRAALGGLYSKTGKKPPDRDLGPSEIVHFRRVLLRRIACRAKDVGRQESEAIGKDVRKEIAGEFDEGYQPGDELSEKFLERKVRSAIESKAWAGTITQTGPFVGMFRKEVREYLRKKLQETELEGEDAVEWLVSLEYSVEIEGEERRKKRRRLAADEQEGGEEDDVVEKQVKMAGKGAGKRSVLSVESGNVQAAKKVKKST